jgi:DNA-binding NarL/FixJ family response regulator
MPALLASTARHAACWSDEVETATPVEPQMSELAQRVASAARKWKLTPRQIQVVRLIARGCGNKDIARELHISLNTVETHVSAILRAADAGTRLELLSKLHADSSRR